MESEKTIEDIKRDQHPIKTIQAVPPICPFMSSAQVEVSCSSRCRLFRGSRSGYECYFQELQSISWNTRKPGNAPPQY